MHGSFQHTNVTRNHKFPFYFCPQDVNGNHSISFSRSWVFYVPIIITVISPRFSTRTSLAVSSPKFYYHLQAPANPSHNRLSQHPSTHQWNLQLVKSRCSSIKAAETSEQCPGALPFPKRLVPLSKSLPLLHTPSAWDGFGVDGFQLLQKTKGRHIWQRSWKMFINHDWSWCCCDVPQGSLWRAVPSYNLINPAPLLPLASGARAISAPHKCCGLCRAERSRFPRFPSLRMNFPQGRRGALPTHHHKNIWGIKRNQDASRTNKHWGLLASL